MKALLNWLKDHATAGILLIAVLGAGYGLLDWFVIDRASGEVQEQISQMHPGLKTMGKNITENTTKIQGVEEDISDIKEDIHGIQTDIKVINKNISENGKNISWLRGYFDKSAKAD